MTAVKDALAEQGCTDQRYIGDGVYAGFDGWQVWLATERAIGAVHMIALEPNVFEGLLRYREHVNKADA